MTKEFEIKKSTVYIVGTIIIIIIGIIFLVANSNIISANIIPSANQEVQIVKLSVKNGNYILNPTEIKKGVLTRIEADLSQMPGCSKSIVIPAFNARKTFSSADNSFEFVPDKSGTFNIVCSMNMYKGSFIVLEESGKKSDYIEPQNNKAGSCLSNSGGCGCGMM